MADTVLQTERLILRRFRDEDLGPWRSHLNTPEVRAHLGGVESDEKVGARFARQKDSWAQDKGGWLAIVRKADGEFLGYCGFGEITTEVAPDGLRGQSEIGWTLRADCWGRGYATEAARGMLALAFEEADLPVICSQTSEANRGSWRVMERLGMERAEALDYDDPAYPPEENPTKVYRLTRDAWRAARVEIRIETERLVLRDWREGDFATLHALCTCPQVMATIGPLHDEDQTRGLLARLQERTALHGHTFWAMERKEDGRVIGFCGVSRGPVPPIEGLLEIGWRVAADCWGQSYAREAAEATLRWIATNRPDEPICAITSVGNVRSRGLMERLGMRYRPDMDFEHPNVEPDSPLLPHVTYWLESAK